MFRKDKRETTRPPRELKKVIPNVRREEEKRIDFNISPYSPYGRFGIWLKTIWRI